MEWPPHKCEMVLTHNEHRNFYDSAEKFISDHELDEDFSDADDVARAISDDEIWVIQWYPATPIGFHRAAASSFDRLMELVRTREWQ